MGWRVRVIGALLFVAALASCGTPVATTNQTLGGGGPAAAIGVAAFGPGGALLATANPDRTITIWDTASGARKFTLTGHGGEVTALGFSADGTLLASGGADKRVEIWDVASGKEVRALNGHAGTVNAVAFSPNGQTLASGGQDGTVRLWEVSTGSQRQSLTGSGGGVTSLAYSPNGQSLASGGADANVQLWDAASGTLTRQYRGHRDAVGVLAFSPDGQSLASGSNDRQVKLWSVTSDQEVRSLTGHGGGILAVSFAPDGASLATGSDDRTARIWDATSGRVKQTLAEHGGAVPAVAFGPDGRRLLSGSRDNSAREWDAATGTLRRTISIAPSAPPAPVATRAIAPATGTIAPNGPPVRAAIDTPNQEVRLTFQGTAGRRLSATVTGSTFEEADIALFGPDGVLLDESYLFLPEHMFEPVTLPTSGTYTLSLKGRGDATGEAIITAYEFADTNGTIVPGGPATQVATTTPGQRMHLKFEGKARQRVSVAVSALNLAEADLYLYAPDGTVMEDMYMFLPETFFDTVELPSDGEYTLTFDPRGALAGGATLTAYFVTDVRGQATIGGAPVRATIDTPGQNASWTFSSGGGRPVTATIEALTIADGDLIIVNPDGSVLDDTYVFQAGTTLAVTLPGSGTYTLVFSPRGGLVGTVTISLR